jgi:hypothetical protein
MSKWFKILLLGVMLCFAFSAFAQPISYQQVVNGVNNVYAYVLSKQATNGAFVFGKNENRNSFLFPTILVLLQLRQLGFPMDTRAFAKGVIFLNENYRLSKTNDFYSFNVPLILQGKTKLNLSNCAQFLKNELVRDYLLSAMSQPEKPKLKGSAVNYYTKKLSTIPIVLDVIKYSDKKELVKIMSGASENVQVQQVDVDAILPSILANLYENLSKTVSDAYSQNEGAMIVLNTQAQINDVILNGYDEKIKEEEMKYIKRDASDILGNSTVKKAIEEVKNSQKSDGSWDISMLKDFRSSNIKESQIEFAKLEVTAMNVYSLLKCGVPAANSTVEKGVEYLVKKLSNPDFLNKNPELLQGFAMPIKALESYLNAKWGKRYSVEKELSSEYLEYAKLDKAKFSDLLSKLYVSSMKYYISQVVFGE